MAVGEVGCAPTRVSVAIADSSTLAGDALVTALGASGLDARLVSGPEGVTGADVVLADSRLEAGHLRRLARDVADEPSCQLVLVAAHNSRAMQQIVRAVGAAASFDRSRDVSELVETVRTVAGGGSPERHGEQPALEGPWSLTTRELEILEIISLGATNADVAEQLGISPHTVRSHLGRILDKLGVGGRLGAVTAARRAGVLPEPRTASA